MILQVQFILNTLQTSINYSFSKKNKVTLILPHFLLVGISNDMIGVLYVLWKKISKVEFHHIL